MLALIPVRDGVLPSGAAEAAAECGGRVLLVGPAAAIDDSLASLGNQVRIVDLGAFGPGRWAAALAPLVADEAVVVLPASPDGRDLAPRLAHQLGRPLFAGAVEITPDHVTVSRQGGQLLQDHHIDRPVVATLQPGIRGVEPPQEPDQAAPPIPVLPATELDVPGDVADCEILAVLPPDVTTMDLEEAPRILGGGAGLDTAERFEQLASVALALGASMGATRVITDRGWVGHERQIGTTGVIVDPELYLSFGISGAVQHTSGLGHPHHVISVNTDPHCPMMQLSDLAIVSDANGVLDALERLLASDGRTIDVSHA